MFPGLPSQHPMGSGVLGSAPGMMANGPGTDSISPGSSMPPFQLSHLHQGIKQDKYDKTFYGTGSEFKNSSPANASTEMTARSTIGSGTGSSNSPPPVTSNPENNTCRLMDYRNQAVAAFTVDGRDLICLPQAFELFLKHLVGGLHTVYTKLKRLDVVPVVCNVEQVRVLRSLGAIQPGVNRCKLISPKEFDILYEDCTNSSARPGRPPKRTGGVPVTPDSIKKQRLQATSEFYHHASSNLLDPKKQQFSHPYLPFPDHAQKSMMPSAGAFPYHHHLSPLNFLPFGHPGLLNLMASHLAANRGAGLDVGSSRYADMRTFNLNGRKEDDHEKPEVDENHVRSKFERHHQGNEDSSNDARHLTAKQQMHHLPLFQHPFVSHHQGMTLTRHPHFPSSGFDHPPTDRPLNLEMNKRSPSPVERRSTAVALNKDSDIQSVASSEEFSDVINSTSNNSNNNNNITMGFQIGPQQQQQQQKAPKEQKDGSCCRNGNESDRVDDDDDDDDDVKIDDVSNVVSASDEEGTNMTVCNGKSPTNQTPGDHSVPLPSPSLFTMDMLLVNMQTMLKMIADKLREKDQQFMEERERLRRKLRKERKARRSLEVQIHGLPHSTSGKARGIPHHVIQTSPMATQVPSLRMDEADKTPTRVKESKCTSAMSSPPCCDVNNEDEDVEDRSETMELAPSESKSPLVKCNTPLQHRFAMTGNGSCLNGSP